MPSGLPAAFVLGLCFGSFATALAYRLPRGLSMRAPRRSVCPHCGHALAARDLLPLLSFLIACGRCRFCRQPIGFFYPAVELATAALTVAMAARYGLSFATAPLVVLLPPLLIAIAAVDLSHKIIPDVLVAALLIVGAGQLALAATVAPLKPALLGAVLYGGGALALRGLGTRLAGREAMGLGDVKFFAAAGFWIGGDAPDAAALFLLISGLAGIVINRLWKARTGEDDAPFGPGLVAGLAATLAAYPPTLLS